MNEKNDGGQAFPRLKELVHHGTSTKRYAADSIGGMTLRDYFAGQALIACAQMFLTIATTHPDAKGAVALWAYEIADAMLAEREK